MKGAVKASTKVTRTPIVWATFGVEELATTADGADRESTNTIDIQTSNVRLANMNWWQVNVLFTIRKVIDLARRIE